MFTESEVLGGIIFGYLNFVLAYVNDLHLYSDPLAHLLLLGRFRDETPFACIGRIHAVLAFLPLLALALATSTHLPHVLADWRKPRHEDFEPRTAWSLFNCFTEVLKDSSLFKLAPRTQALHGLLDQFTGVKFSRN